MKIIRMNWTRANTLLRPNMILQPSITSAKMKLMMKARRNPIVMPSSLKVTSLPLTWAAAISEM